MTKIDEKSINQIIQALEGAKEYHREFQMKREEKLWKKIDEPFRLLDILPMLTKTELDDIRKQLNLSGMSSLKKAELASKLARLIPAQLEKILLTFDQERYNLIRNIIKTSGALSIDDEFPIYKIVTLMNQGVIFPVIKDGQKQIMMPVELIEKFTEIDSVELRERIHQNTEWIRLAHGMIYYYGVMESYRMLEKIEAFTKGEVDIRRYSEVVRLASDYYQEFRILAYTTGRYIADKSIYNVEDIIKEQKSRPSVEYYPFTKKQLLKAGEPGFIEKSAAMVKLLRFLSESYDLTVEDKDEIAEELFYMINSDDHPTQLLEYLGSILENPSFEFMQQLTAFVMDVHNHTRMWILKGYSPTELRKKDEEHLNPLPAVPFSQPQATSNVIDLNTRRKVGRNDPCPCGSGKKHKKCCGK